MKGLTDCQGEAMGSCRVGGRMKMSLLGALLLLSAPVFSLEPAVTLEQADGKAREIVAKAKATLTTAPVRVQEKSGKSGNKLQAALGACSDDVRRGFLNSLVFVDGKFAGAEVNGVQNCLGDGGYKALRAMFGPIIIADNKGYWCESRATCAESSSRICTSSCMSDLTANASTSGDGYLSIEKTIADRPVAVRNYLLDNLDLENCRIESAALKR